MMAKLYLYRESPYIHDDSFSHSHCISGHYIGESDSCIEYSMRNIYDFDMAFQTEHHSELTYAPTRSLWICRKAHIMIPSLIDGHNGAKSMHHDLHMSILDIVQRDHSIDNPNIQPYSFCIDIVNDGKIRPALKSEWIDHMAFSRTFIGMEKMKSLAKH